MQVPEKNGAFSLLGICNPEPRHHGLPRTGAAEIGKRGGVGRSGGGGFGVYYICTVRGGRASEDLR